MREFPAACYASRVRRWLLVTSLVIVGGCGSELVVSETGGTGGGGTGGGSGAGGQPGCPPARPVVGAACSPAGQRCDYGPDDCLDRYICTGTSWTSEPTLQCGGPPCPELPPSTLGPSMFCFAHGQVCAYPVNPADCGTDELEAVCGDDDFWHIDFGSASCDFVCPEAVDELEEPCNFCCDGPCDFDGGTSAWCDNDGTWFYSGPI